MISEPLEHQFDDALYPNQRVRNVFAIFLLVVVHVSLIYLLLHNQVEQPIKPGAKEGQLFFVNLQAETKPDILPLPEQVKPKSKPKKKQSRAPAISKPAEQSVPDIMSEIAVAKQKRQVLEQEAAKQNRQAQLAEATPSEDVIMARMKANINAATFNRKGKNGIFQVTSKGVQTGRFTFRGWDNDPRESTWRSYEVDAGVGGDVELALIRRMIEIIRDHYSGDFNWESQRLGRVVVLSARVEDTAKLETFLRKEFFN